MKFKYIFIFLFILFGLLQVSHIPYINNTLTQVFADDDNDEDEHEDEDDEEDEEEFEDEDDEDYEDDEYEEKTIYVTEYVTLAPEETLEPVSVPVYKTIVDPGYNIDTDGDGLVDAIDPDPQVHQKRFYTDTDGDSMPDAFDVNPNVDDFYLLDEADSNGNGIIDSYEQQ